MPPSSSSSPSPDLIALPVALPLRGRPVLVIGGADEAEEKTQKLVACGARVTLVALEVTPVLRRLALSGEVTWFARGFVSSDTHGAHLVMLTEPDEALARELVALRARGRFWLCAVDQPAYTDVYLVSTVMRGPVQIGISTSGRAPLLARALRKALDLGLDARFATFAHRIAQLRSQLRDAPKVERKLAIERALNGFAMEVRLSYPADHAAKSDVT